MALNRDDPEVANTGSTLVATITDIGGKACQQDSHFISASDDGSWVIAVADGLSIPDGGERASAAAVRDFPQRIVSREEMVKAFRQARDRVVDLYRNDTSGRMWNEWRAPATTLCVVAHTPESGTLAAWAGDSIPFLITGFSARQMRSSHIGHPHVGAGGALASFLGPPIPKEAFGVGGTEYFTVKRVDMAGQSVPYAILAASDGLWVKALLGKRQTCPLGDLEYEDLFGDACRNASNAEDVAISALDRARMYGLSDNATAVTVFVGDG